MTNESQYEFVCPNSLHKTCIRLRHSIKKSAHVRQLGSCYAFLISSAQRHLGWSKSIRTLKVGLTVGVAVQAMRVSIVVLAETISERNNGTDEYIICVRHYTLTIIVLKVHLFGAHLMHLFDMIRAFRSTTWINFSIYADTNFTQSSFAHVTQLHWIRIPSGAPNARPELRRERCRPKSKLRAEQIRLLK